MPVVRADTSITPQTSREAPPQTAEAQGSPRDSVSGQAHARTCGQDRPTAASPLRLVRPVLASAVPPRVAGQGSACKCGAGCDNLDFRRSWGLGRCCGPGCGDSTDFVVGGLSCDGSGKP